MMMVRKSKGLGERHQRILDFLRVYQSENKYPPSIREIGEKTGISSTSVVNYYLDQLKKMGYLERDTRVSRGLRLTEKVNAQVVGIGTVIEKEFECGRINLGDVGVPVISLAVISSMDNGKILFRE